MRRSALGLEYDESQQKPLTGGIWRGIVGASVNKEDDMYSKTKFDHAKSDLVYSLLYSPKDTTSKVQVRFIHELLRTGAELGIIRQHDVERATELSGVFEAQLNEDERDEVLSWMRSYGDRFLGRLSAEQARDLRKIREFCLRIRDAGNTLLVKDLADLL